MNRTTIVSTLSALLLAQAPVLADSIRLVGGDVLQGTIVAEGESSVTIDHAALGRIEVARAQIAAIERTAPAPETPEESKPTATLPAPVPPPPAKPDGRWKFALSLGFTGSKNDETSNWDVRAAAEAKRETEVDRTTVTGEYYFKTSDGTETDNNLLVRASRSSSSRTRAGKASSSAPTRTTTSRRGSSASAATPVPRTG